MNDCNKKLKLRYRLKKHLIECISQMKNMKLTIDELLNMSDVFPKYPY
jgi:hypothetical protein